MFRGALVVLLSFGVLLGPNFCCCAIAFGVSPAKQTDLPAGPSCCCKVEKRDAAEPKSRPSSPDSNDECPCKKSGKKVVVPPSATSQAEAAAQFLSRSDLKTCGTFEPFDLDGAFSSLDGFRSQPRDKSASAHARRPILRC